MSRPDSTSLHEAHTEAVRTASRLSMLGALGFGLALLMAAVLVSGGGILSAGYGLETALFAASLGGGIVFTVLAVRASSMARAYERHLAGSPPRPRPRRPRSRRGR